MNERLTPPDWDSYEEGMLINVADMKLYYESFTEVVDERSTKNELAVGTLDGRVTALEQSTPVGPGGKGAYLNLGGTPERYPTAEEMVAGDTPESTSFLVVARNDGIYFYNPKSKLLIPPKKGGGTVAIHASFPDIFDEGHTIKHDTRIGKSGVYTAKCADVGLDANFLSYDTAKILVVTTADMEYQTALHPDGTASRTFTAGNNVQPWAFHTGTGGGTGGGVDPLVIQEINRRLAELESKPDPIGTFEGLADVEVDSVNDINGLLYLGADGKVRGGSTNPMLGMGAVHVHPNSVGYAPLITDNNANTTATASSPVIIMSSPVTRTVTMPSIVEFNTYHPLTNQVREGRTTYIVNMSAVSQNVRLAPGATNAFFKDGVFSTTAISIPANTTYIFSPSLMDDGLGNDPITHKNAWSYMGSVSMVATDVDGILVEIQDIKDKMEEQRVLLEYTATEQIAAKAVVEGIQTTQTDLVDRVNTLEASDGEFIHLSDTPDTYTGNEHKSIRVNGLGNALEFIDSPETAILAALAGGNLPIKWNNLKQKIAASSSNIAASNIAENAFTLGLGGTAGRQFILPNIVDADTVPLPANSVREGRLTILSQQGGGHRTVTLSDGCKFTSAGVTSTTNPTIPAGQSWILLPAIYANGDKNWSLIGTFSANQHASDYHNGHVRVGDRSITADTIVTYGSVNQTNVAKSRLVGTTTPTSREISMPEIMPLSHVEPLANTQVRQGKIITAFAASTGPSTLVLASGQKWVINNVESDGNRVIPSGIMETYLAASSGGVGKWFMLSRHKGDGSPIEFDELDSRVTALEAGGGAGGNVDVAPLIIRLDDHQARIESLEAGGGSGVDMTPVLDRITAVEGVNTTQQTELDNLKAQVDVLEDMDLAPLTGRVTDVETFANAVEERVDLLEAKPHPRFSDLTDTPSAGNPGKLIGYNLAGDAITSYDRVTSLTGLSDTPNSYTGHATKLMTVKTDETGFEFTPFPRLQPLQDEINALTTGVMDGFQQFNDVDDRLQTSIDGHNTRLTALEGAAGNSGASSFLELTDTPASLTAKKYLIVNDAGDGVTESIETTEDVAQLARFAEGIDNGHAMVNINCVGGEVPQTGEENISGEVIVEGSVLLVAAWKNMTYVWLPSVEKFDTSPLPDFSVREGRVTTIYNCSSNSKPFKVKIDSRSNATRLIAPNYAVITEYEIPAGFGVRLMPVFSHTETEANRRQWMVLEKFRREQS